MSYDILRAYYEFIDIISGVFLQCLIRSTCQYINFFLSESGIVQVYQSWLGVSVLGIVVYGLSLFDQTVKFLDSICTNLCTCIYEYNIT